jgi:hypothetical protein
MEDAGAVGDAGQQESYLRNAAVLNISARRRPLF